MSKRIKQNFKAKVTFSNVKNHIFYYFCTREKVITMTMTITKDYN